MSLPLPSAKTSVGAGHLPDLSIVPESTLVLFQREFNIGDIVKRSLSNVESAVVVGYDTEVQLEHAIDGRKVKGWVPWGKLRSDMTVEARYRVMYGQWVGIVEEVSHWSGRS
jgi:ubiquitin-conjugating enzyme E2 O